MGFFPGHMNRHDTHQFRVFYYLCLLTFDTKLLAPGPPSFTGAELGTV